MGLPYSKFFWADYMRATRMLSCTAKGAWMDILCIIADADDCGTLTNSATAWARYIGLTRDELLGVVQELEAGGVGNIKVEGEQITITSNRLKRDFKEYKAQCEQAAAAGKKSGAARRRNKMNDRSTTVQRKTNNRCSFVERNANETRTIPEARSQKPERERENSAISVSADANLPTWPDVQTYAKQIGVSMDSAQRFYDHHEGNNAWIGPNHRMINWKHKLKVWAEKDKTIKPNGKPAKFQAADI